MRQVVPDKNCNKGASGDIMLNTIDVMVGLVLVMLIMSMVVTMLTQFIASILNLRGTALRHGLGTLLSLLDNTLDAGKARELADLLLRDPLIATPNLFFPGTLRRSLATAVHREELTKLILEFAANGPPTDRRDPLRTKPPGHGQAPMQPQQSPLWQALRTSLASNGIPNPEQTLNDIRTAALALERTSPEMSNGERLNAAILTFADSPYIGKLNGWFDQTVDRASDLFTLRVRQVTLVIALIVAFVLQLDVITLVNRLSTDDTLRRELVLKAVEHPELLAPERFGITVPTPSGTQAAGTSAVNSRADGQATAPASSAPAAPTTPPGGTSGGVAPPPSSADQLVKDLRANVQAATHDLAGTGLVTIPRSFEAWQANWGDRPLPMLSGILISACLMSLGAPFWYEALKNLLRLRSLIAQRDDTERTTRQTTQAPAAAAGGAAPPNPAPV